MLSGTCGDAVSYEIVRTAAESFAPPGGQADARTAAQRRMDGLIAACKAALDGGQAPERHGAAPHITILVTDETLTQASHNAVQAPGTAQPGTAQPAAGVSGRAAVGQPRSAAGAPSGMTGHGTMLTARQVLALCCGAQVGAIRRRDGLPPDVTGQAASGRAG